MSEDLRKWIRIAKADDIAESDVQRYEIGGQCVALYNIDGKFYATDDICTHQHAHLSDGYVDGDKVECPLHQGLFHIPSGKALSPPVTENLRTYSVKVVDGDVLIDL